MTRIFNMNNQQTKALRELRDQGYAIVVFNPEELGGAYADDVESRLVELGWEVIETLQEE
jgi:hypothetical protein